MQLCLDIKNRYITKFNYSSHARSAFSDILISLFHEASGDVDLTRGSRMQGVSDIVSIRDTVYCPVNFEIETQ